MRQAEAPRRKLAGLQGVGWERETRRPFSLGTKGGVYVGDREVAGVGLSSQLRHLQ